MKSLFFSAIFWAIFCAIFSAVFLFAASPAYAANVTANETLPRGRIISASDINIQPSEGEDRADILQSYLGKELKRTVYAGHKLSPNYVGNPILVKRNARVDLVIWKLAHGGARWMRARSMT